MSMRGIYLVKSIEHERQLILVNKCDVVLYCSYTCYFVRYVIYVN